MAFLLHIETATEQCSVALSKDTKLISRKSFLGEGFKHATQVHPFIDIVLKEATLHPQELDAIAVSQGPGSFTGLRIGSVTAKGLCFALDIPLIAIPTLQLLAAPHWENSHVISLIDARRDEVYTATYATGGAILESTKAHIISSNSFAEYAHQDVCFVGTGAKKAKALLPQNKKWQFFPTYPSATAMPALATESFAKQEFVDTTSFTPSYIKPVNITSSKKDALGRRV